MYSVVMLAAMTASAPETPQFGLRGRGCVGVYSCYGYSSCWGCAGCVGCVGCTGCWGGGYLGPRVAVANAGGWHFYAPYLGNAGGRYGYAPGYGYRLAPVANEGPRVSTDVWGADYRYSASTPFPPAPKPEGEKREKDENLKGSARLLLEVPADARVYIDGQLTRSTNAVRSFHTPPLKDGETFYYEVRVETPSGQKPIVQDKRIYVRANEVVRESFRDVNAASIASK